MSVWFKSRLNPWYIWIPSNPNLYSTKIIMKMRWQTIASNVSIRTISPTATPLPKAYDCVAVYIAGRRTSLVVYGWWPQPPTKNLVPLFSGVKPDPMVGSGRYAESIPVKSPPGALVCMCRMYRSVHRDVPSVFVCIGMGARACDRHIPNVPTQIYRHIRDKMAVVTVSLVTVLIVNT